MLGQRLWNDNTVLKKEMKPEFDSLTLNWDEFYWRSHVTDLKPIGSEFELHIETKDEEEVEPNPLQLHVWDKINSETEIFQNLILKGMFDYYCGARPKFEKLGPEWVTNMPRITRQEEISSMLRLNYIQIAWPYDGKDPKVGFSFGCQWDREHGAGIIIKENQIVDVGGADCLHCS